MTCYTSQFQKPSNAGTTLDESLVLHEGGGAVATWGPTGLSVAHGHDKLQTGFYKSLWKPDRPPMTARMGELVEAGYFEQFATGVCCHDVRRTFLIFGDPLTTVRVSDRELGDGGLSGTVAQLLGAGGPVYLPFVARQ
jgi:hypothetical protein